MTEYWKRAVRGLIAFGFSLGVFSLFNLFDFESQPSSYVFNYVFPLYIVSCVVHGLMPLFFARIHLALKISPDTDEESEIANNYRSL